MILVPVKNTSSAKQRLGAVLDQPSRTALAQAMLHDVLSNSVPLARSAKRELRPGGCSRHQRSLSPWNLASEYGFEVIPIPIIPERPAPSRLATRICVERGIDSTLVIPADIPLIQAWELRRDPEARAPSKAACSSPLADGRGTNAIFRRPANLFPLRFGNDSFKPHHAAAQATGKPCIVLNLPGIAVDVDNPEDLQQLISLPGETRAQHLAREYARAGTMTDIIGG
jgi:2-phospho-L-lactate/phosphoenolpyruvate guanylyltransferase